MAKRATYTEEDKARCYLALNANDGNIKRTAKETGFPETTVRRWAADFKHGLIPRQDVVEQLADDFISKAEDVRWKALLEAERKIPEGKLNELTTLMGVLTDKIDRVRGVGKPDPGQHSLPDAKELAVILGGAVAMGLEMARQRQGEIIDADVIEQPALPA